MTKILILGGSGFIGEALLPKLSNHHVTLLSRAKNNRFNLPQITCDRNTDDILHIDFKDHYDVVIDISAIRKDWVVNAQEALKDKADKYIFISSAAVYDEFDGLNTDESMPTGGGSIWGNYGKNKSDCEDALLYQKDFSVCILRPTYMFGEHNHLDRETFVWSRIREGNPIFLPKNSKAEIQFSDVKLVAETIRSLIEDRWHEGAFNVADNKAISMEQWVGILESVSGGQAKIERIENDSPYKSLSFFPFADHSVSVSVSKLENVIGVSAQSDLRSRFSEIYAFHKKTKPFRLRLTSMEKTLYKRKQCLKLLSKYRKIRLYLEYLARCTRTRMRQTICNSNI